ncbi:MAG: hypothetical protein EXR99_01340 [Gemmataceae bacterium]|nr:hypothetical protein [Gemmataceae bacterium]
MPELLVSVRNVGEARIAKEAGADWIDVKEPLRGPMGRPDKDVARRILAACESRFTSCAMGELLTLGAEILESWPSFHFKKFGLSGWGQNESVTMQKLQYVREKEKARGVPVLYADHEQCQALPVLLGIKKVVETGFTALVVDTWGKKSGWLGQFLDFRVMRKIQDYCQKHGLRWGLAGSLNESRIHILLGQGIQPDWFGLRGGVCFKSSRLGRISERKIRAIKEVLVSGSPVAAIEN